MSQTLYRKYRPQLFAELIGQNHIKTTLKNEILGSQVAQAYLFSGPRGTGKTTVARLLARSLNCHERKEKEFEPCGQCLSCQEITAGRSLDLIEIDAASHTGVDNVRENIIDNVRFTPYRDKFKVFIIDEVHMLSVSAFNALLKTLEEPPAHVVFVLCTTEIYKLPETIISRCQRFDFKKVELKILADYLTTVCQHEGVKVDRQVIGRIAFSSAGFVRDALSMLGQILSLNEKEIGLEEAMIVLPRSDFEMLIKLTDCLIDKNIKAGVEMINDFLEQGVDLERTTLDLIEYLRNLALIKLQIEAPDLADSGEQIVSQAEKLELNQITKMIDIFSGKVGMMKNSEIIQLPLEMAVMEICQTKVEVKTQVTEEKKQSNHLGNGQGEYKNRAKPNFLADELAVSADREDVKDELKTQKQKIEKEQKVNDNLSLAEVENKWPQVVAGSQAVNHSVTVALETACPIDLNGNNLEIAFEHDFYCERFKEVKPRQLIEQVLKNVFGKDLVVKCSTMSQEKKKQLVEERNKKKQEEEENFKTVLNDFGGKVVE